MVQISDILPLDGTTVDFSDFTGDIDARLGRKPQEILSSDLNEQFIIDTVFAKVPGAVFDNILTGYGNDFVVGNNNDNIIGSGAGDDTVFGQGGNDSIFGGYGNDRLIGGYGNDRLKGEDGDDLLVGGQGNDTLDGGQGEDTLWGQDDNDVLFGGGGDDYLSGGNGNDFLNGGRGSDELRGGAGADYFFIGDFLENSGLTNIDTILDFEVGVDTIDLSGLDDNGITEFSDLTVSNVFTDGVDAGSKIRLSYGSDFAFDVVFQGTDFNLAADDFIFGTDAPVV